MDLGDGVICWAVKALDSGGKEGEEEALIFAKEEEENAGILVLSGCSLKFGKKVLEGGAKCWFYRGHEATGCAVDF